MLPLYAIGLLDITHLHIHYKIVALRLFHFLASAQNLVIQLPLTTKKLDHLLENVNGHYW